MAQSGRMQQLQAFQKQMPIANQRTADQLQAGRMVGLQQAVASATAATPQAAQQIGAQSATAAGQVAVQSAQTAQQQQKQLGAAALQQQAADSREELNSRQLGLAQKSRALSNQLASLDSRLKNELWDKQMKFQQDELGRQQFNERQLFDYQLSKVKNEEEWLNFEQDVRQVSERRMQMLKTAQAKLEQTLKNDFQKGQQELDQEQRKRLIEAKRALEQKIAEERRRQSNRASMFQAGGTIVGAVAGGVLTGGNPVGVMVGAQVGGGLGTLAGSGL